MKIHIGSENKVKVEAVSELLQEYDHLKNALLKAISTASGVSDQPMSLEETVQGAINRAKEVLTEGDYGMGIESGLMHVPGTKSGFMDVCVCAIYDGRECHIGLSSAWEAPQQVMDYMLNEGLDMGQASKKAGLTDNPDVGAAEGLIGIVSKGKIDRKAYTKEAIRTALIHLED